MREFDSSPPRPHETVFQWARRSGTYWEMRICQCCMIIEANGETCSQDDCDTCRPGGGYEKWHEAHPDRTITLGILTDECGHDLDIQEQDDAHRDTCEYLGFCRSSCDLCGSWLHGDRYAATAWPKRFPQALTEV